MKPSLPIEAKLLVPHRSSMLLIDELLIREEQTAMASASIPQEGLFNESPIFQEYFIELIAQTIAAAQGYDALSGGEDVKDGMLVGIDTFSFYGTAKPGSRLTVYAELAFEFGAVKIISGNIQCDGNILAEGKIKVWEKPEGDEVV